MLLRVAAHVAAALRLRGSAPARGVPADPAAVLDDRGRLVEAAPRARARAARDALVAAAREIVAARRTRQASEAEALAAWRALVSGKWSIVGCSDTDGRRFFVAVENAPEVAAADALAGLGHANKLIAYQLGLSDAVVARALASAQRKLSVRSRPELVALVAALLGGRSAGEVER